MSPTRCSSCGAEIRWVRTEANNRPTPLDPKPVEDGNVQITIDGKARVLGGFDLLWARDAGYDLYRTHFSTCPNAASHRKVAT